MYGVDDGVFLDNINSWGASASSLLAEREQELKTGSSLYWAYSQPQMKLPIAAGSGIPHISYVHGPFPATVITKPNEG